MSKRNETRITKLMSKMFQILEISGNCTDEIRKEYDDICNNYHEVLLEELDTVVSESEPGKVCIKEASN